MSPATDRIKAVFLAALDKATRAERAAYLEEACGQDSGLRQRVEALLQAHDQPDDLLDRPAAEHLSGERDAEGTPQGEQPGTVVAGRYKLLEQIGEGGMGTVWVAEQTQPVRRKVALKLIKAGMDSRSVLSRFDAERQALAVMDHPNIAKVLDGGTAEDGRPFFVMEYVKGVPITQYCDEAHLGIAERLALLVAVCQAVQHAHQKGVIHRDLKPANILVCLYDGTPVPKVIDFGLAKAIHQPLTEHTLHTAHGVVMGTPLYMSPEQAEFNNLDVDTRTDIYSLGVILYELLTGTTPLEKQRFKAASWPEVLRLIKEEDPPRPSARLSGSGSLPGVAAQRQLEPVKLTKLVRGELDWIVMKSLEKDRARRYDTANGFAADLIRYLGGEPVLAHPPSTSYRLQKFVRRHRPQVLAAGVVLVALVAGVIGTSWGLVRAEERRREAEAEKVRALAAADAERRATEAEKAAHEQAQKRLRQIEKGNEILTGIFAELDIRKIKEGDKPLEAVLAERLVKAAAQLEGEAVGEPLAVAALQERLGLSLVSLGFGPQAIALLEKARATRQARLGPDDPATLRNMHNLALAYLAAEQLDKALPLYEEAIRRSKAKLGPTHPDTITSMGNLAAGYHSARRLDKALPLFEETLALRKAQLGPDHPATLSIMNNMAMSYLAAGRLDKALPLLTETFGRTKARLGPDHPDTLTVMNNLGEGYLAVAQADRAVSVLKETHERSKARLGLDHPGTLRGMNNLARAYQASGRLDKALPLYEEVVRRSKAKLGPNHPDTITYLGNLAKAFLNGKQPEKARPLIEEFVRAKRTQLVKDKSRFALMLTQIALELLEARQFPAAETYLKEALALREQGQPGAWYTFNTRSMLGGALLGQKKYGEAEPLLLSGYEGMKQREKTIPPPGRIRLTEAVQRLVALYEATGNKDAAARWRTELEKARTP